jgi:hypothetical protein
VHIKGLFNIRALRGRWQAIAATANQVQITHLGHKYIHKYNASHPRRPPLSLPALVLPSRYLQQYYLV